MLQGDLENDNEWAEVDKFRELENLRQAQLDKQKHSDKKDMMKNGLDD